MDCGLNELKLNGGRFIWSKGRDFEVIFERLGRGLATEGWLSLFPSSTKMHLSSTISNHVPLLIQICDQSQSKRGFRRPFRFENIWIRDAACKEVIMGC